MSLNRRVFLGGAAALASTPTLGAVLLPSVLAAFRNSTRFTEGGFGRFVILASCRR